MRGELHQLHIYFLPSMSPGHMIPLIDIARKFAKLGNKSTIITTPLNALQFSKAIERDRENGSDISIFLVKFPWQESGLPENCENLSSTTSFSMSLNFFKAYDLLQEPVEKLLEEGNPDCIIAGAFFWWATDTARKFNIPRLVFYGTGFFPACIFYSLKEHRPHEKVGSDDEEFVVPFLPGVVKICRRQLADQLKEGDDHPLADFVKKVFSSDLTSFGVIVNSFYELEPAYADHYKEFLGRKAWNIGPVSLFNKSNDDKSHRGKEQADSSDDNCLKWLDSKKPNSVVYVCFGSMAIFSKTQLLQIAKGLEASGQEFIWAVSENSKDEVTNTEWSMEEFERRVEGRGLIVKGWAPQVLILDHESVGGFVTHCGWNSVLEGVAAGVPMVTWPLSAEQFFNEKLVVEVLKIGIPVGAQAWTRRTDDREPIEGKKIEKAVVELMVGEEAETIRRRARELGDTAKRAVEEGGSSDNELNSLLEEMRGCLSLK